MLAPAVVGTLVEELLGIVADGEGAQTHLGCLSSPARLCPRDLGNLALYACLLFVLPVGGGGRICRHWPRLCYGGGTWGIYC